MNLHAKKLLCSFGSGTLLVTTLLVISSIGASAQESDSTRQMYGVPDDEFLRAIWIGADDHHYQTNPVSGTVTYNATAAGTLWDYAASMGVNTLRVNANRWGAYDQARMILDDIPAASDSQRVILSHMGTNSADLDIGNEFDYFNVGFSQNIEFFPFDSSRFSSWQTKFLNLSPVGRLANNAGGEFNEFDEPAGELIMSSEWSDVPGDHIASRIAYNLRGTSQTHRYKSRGSPEAWHDSTVQNVDYPWMHQRNSIRHLSTWYVSVKGHVFENPPGNVADDDDSLLRIEVWHEVPKGWRYRHLDSNYTSTDTLSRQIHTIYVRKQDLAPEATNFDRYRSVSYPFTTDAFFATSGDSISKRIDLKVFWTGAEKVAIRSISLRDPVAELMLGNSANSATFKQRIYEHIRDIVIDNNGTANDTTDDELRQSVIAIGCAGEYLPTEIDAMREFNHFVKRNFGESTNIAFRLPAYGEDGDMHNLHHIDSLHEIFTQEFEVNAFRRFLGPHFAVADGIAPAIKEHNVGRFGLKVGNATVVESPIPELVLPAGSIDSCRKNIETYETVLQRIGFGGQYAPRVQPMPEPLVPVARPPWQAGRSQLTALGRMAEDARDRHRRLLLVLFNTTQFEFRKHMYGGNAYVDTNIWRIPEQSELRAITNLGIAYGVKGLVHQVSSSHSNSLKLDSASGLWLGLNDSWGVVGPGTGDTTVNRFASYPVAENVATTTNGGYGTARCSIPDLYVGWQARSAETRRINEWIKRIGPHLMKLRWRTGYSVHFTVPQKYQIRNFPNNDTTSRYESLGWRAIDIDEPIDYVRTRDPRRVTATIGGAGYNGGYSYRSIPYTTGLDSLEQTYVDLGFFETKRGVNPRTAQLDPVYDTNYVFVVNRRCFERPEDIDPASARGILMDSLAEMREVWLKAGLPLRSQHTFLRIREIAADSTVVPGRVTRRSLDTIVSSHAWFSIVLGPGRGALLQITHLPPDESIITGELAYNNQRKIAFDGRRYHAVYTRANDTAVPNHVYYRRSLPVTDSTGSILWEPRDAGPLAEHRLSYVPTDTLWNNRHPSLTVRSRWNPETSNYDTVVTVVWTCHSWAHAPAGPHVRQVAVRNILSNGDLEPAILQDSIEWAILKYEGYYGSDYGTPVICRAHDGEFIAWSDSTRGIVARFRRDGTGSEWWNTFTAYSDTLYIGTIGSKFPTVPTFTHVANAENTSGIAWQQPESYRGAYIGAGAPLSIRYRRMYYDSTLNFVNGHWITSGNPLIVSPQRGLHYHPSMDLQQDRWGGLQDCITWESVEGRPLGTAGDIERYGQIQFRSVATMPNRGSSQLWGWAQLVDRPFDTVVFSGRDTTYRSANLHPNAASLSQYFSATEDDPATTTVAWNSQKYPNVWEMLEASIRWADVRFRDRRKYTWGGRYLNGSTAMVPHQNRHAVLYSDVGDTLRTTRQYFLARARPVGYLAEGREVVIRLNDSSGIIITVEDPWISGYENTTPLSYGPRAIPNLNISSLASVEGLMRTETFAASDSTRLGIVSRAIFFGDTAGLASMRFSVSTKVYDSASNSIVYKLDSFAVRIPDLLHQRVVDTTLVFLSGRYRIVTIFDTAAVAVVPEATESVYPVADRALQIEDTSQLNKLRRTDRHGGMRARISAQPNPTANATELRFTIPQADYVTVTIYDEFGRELNVPLQRSGLDPGRYAIDVDTSNFPAGAYIVELRTSRARVTEKVIVRR
jgi:hypothetical protein